jgi:hypothetical protein
VKTKIHYSSEVSYTQVAVIENGARRITADLVITHDGDLSDQQKIDILETIKAGLKILNNKVL